jgi:hypothetical protein
LPRAATFPPCMCSPVPDRSPSAFLSSLPALIKERRKSRPQAGRNASGGAVTFQPADCFAVPLDLLAKPQPNRQQSSFTKKQPMAKRENGASIRYRGLILLTDYIPKRASSLRGSHPGPPEGKALLPEHRPRAQSQALQRFLDALGASLAGLRAENPQENASSQDCPPMSPGSRVQRPGTALPFR